MSSVEADLAARRRALDPHTSFIVQAPAGSGKTELLIQRYLQLLARVETPEAVAAITFTKKAAGEMRARVLNALRLASSGVAPQPAHELVTFQLAQAVLARDREAGWNLLENPARMRVQTIDALCAAITRQMPWLARFGAPPEVTEKARDLYRQGARNTLQNVAAEEEAGVLGPLSTLLLHLDNHFGNAEKLIAQMLEKRDQWLRHTGAGASGDLDDIRKQLEASLAAAIEREVAALRDSVPLEALPDLKAALRLPGIETLDHWLQAADLLLTQKGTLRKKLSPARMADSVQNEPEFLERLHEIRRLPPARFEESQWRAMEAVVDVLPKAVAELRLVFADTGRVDFTELSLRASEALGHLEAPTDLALSMGYRIEHLLIDEFQDTSLTQFELLAKLTAGWDPGDGRTLFLVGDPMQSIYRFRQADVSLFLKARREGVGALRPEPVTLTVNFRSGPQLVDWVNRIFSAILPSYDDIGKGAVSHTASVASRTDTVPEPAVYPFPNDSRGEEAEAVLGILAQAQGSVAILVRARNHLASIVTLLREQGIPFQAIEIDQLGDRPVIQDLMALTFALLHLADRISWLAVLRAPWCGLTIEDLHAIAGDPEQSRKTVWDLLHQADLSLTEAGRSRWRRIEPELSAALDARGRVPLRTLVEQTWLRLGGPACVAVGSDLADAEAYFDLLEGLDQGGDLTHFATLREQVEELFAQPEPLAPGGLQIMTIHKAKGLEFDTVILPGLGQRPRQEDPSLLTWQEQEGDLLLSPIGTAGNEKDPIYKYLTHLESDKVRQENARLLYVAATRARNSLHLLGCAKPNAPPDAGSFLKLLWPVLGHHFAAVHAQQNAGGITAQTVAPVRQIRRLPLAWRRPEALPAVHWKHESAVAIEEPDKVSFEWVGDASRHAGTALHACLQLVAAEGLERWDAARVAAAAPALDAMLANLGVPPLERPETCARVKKALMQTLGDERGRWILARHAEAESELDITGLVDGRVVQGRIDRTFIDENGVRWIVDYKTGMHEGGGLETFLASERERYGPQLEGYARLLAQRDERPIRLALYFPLLNAFVEWPAPALKRRQASLF